MKNDFLFLNVRDSKVKLGEYEKGKFAVVSYDGKTAFIYGVGHKKVKNIVEIDIPETFSYPVFKDLLDKYGFIAVCGIFGVCYSYMASRFAYRCFERFADPNQGQANFERFQKMWDMCQELSAVIKSRYGFNDPVRYQDRRCYSYDNWSFTGINPYHYLENSLSVFFTTNVFLDVFGFEMALKEFLAGGIVHGGIKPPVEGFEMLGRYDLPENEGEMSKTDVVMTNGELVRFPEHSMCDLCNWIFGEGYGEKIASVFCPAPK